jgi:hypothetical protein
MDANVRESCHRQVLKERVRESFSWFDLSEWFSQTFEQMEALAR